MNHRIQLARPSQPEGVRLFAEAVEAILEVADPETLARGRGHTHSMSRNRIEPGTASFEVSRTLRSRVTWVTAEIRIDSAGVISGECECPSDEATCEHIAAALITLVHYVSEDDRRLMRLKGMSDKEIEAVEESRRPGRTRWAASAYTGGPSPAEAIARTPAPLPELPSAPESVASVDFSAGEYSFDSTTSGMSIRGLEAQAALTAAAALAALAADNVDDSMPPMRP